MACFRPSRCFARLCSAGMLEAAKVLVHEGIDINQDDGADTLLLHVAASHSRPSIVQFLVNRGANVTLRSSKYGSPLIAALEGTMVPFLRSSELPESCQSLATLLRHPEPSYDGKVIISNEHQYKPGYRELSECEQIVRIIFDAGAEIDTTTRSFGNALYLASYMAMKSLSVSCSRGWRRLTSSGSLRKSTGRCPGRGSSEYR